MRTAFRRRFASEFSRNILTLISGTAAGQAISILAAPFLTRIYSPADYGALGTFMAVSSTIVILSSFQYSLAILMPEKEEDSIGLFQLCFLFVTLFTIFSFLIISFFNSALVRALSADSLRNWLIYIPLSIFLGGMIPPLTVLANRRKAFSAMSWSRVLPSILTVTISVIIGLLVDGPSGLIIAYLSGQALNCIYLMIVFIRLNLPLFERIPFLKLKGLARQYGSFAKFTTPAEFVNVFTTNIPIFLLNHLSGMQAVGAYNLANRLLGMPTTIVASAFSEVFKQKATQDFRESKTCRRIFIKTSKNLAIVSFLPFLLLGIFGEWFFVLVFGSPWRLAGQFSQVLAILFLMKFISSPVSYVYYIVGKLKEDFLLHLVILFLSLLSFYIGFFLFNDPVGMIAMYSVFYAIMYGVYFVRSYQFSAGVNQ